jgi:hypothetical protein
MKIFFKKDEGSKVQDASFRMKGTGCREKDTG